MLTIDLSGKRALVTGANTGIGEAIALKLAEAGADVAINFITHPEKAETVAARIRAMGRKALTHQADISDPAQVNAMFEKLHAEWGPLDILVNNAGIDGAADLAWQSDPAHWRRVIEINLFGTYYCCREAMAKMVERKSGTVINMSSVHENIAWGRHSAYAASKSAIAMLTKTLAQEAAPFGVRVLAIAPGAIKTAINQDVWSDPAGLADLEDKIPLKRMGTPNEIAGLVAALASDLGSYVTGSTILIDGGMTDYPDFAHGG